MWSGREREREKEIKRGRKQERKKEKERMRERDTHRDEEKEGERERVRYTERRSNRQIYMIFIQHFYFSITRKNIYLPALFQCLTKSGMAFDFGEIVLSVS